MKTSYVDKVMTVSFDLMEMNKWFDFSTAKIIFPFTFSNSLKALFKKHTQLELTEQNPHLKSAISLDMLMEKMNTTIDTHLEKIVNYHSKNVSEKDIQMIKTIMEKTETDFLKLRTNYGLSTDLKGFYYGLCDEHIPFFKNNKINYASNKRTSGHFLEFPSYCMYLIEYELFTVAIIKMKNGEVIKLHSLKNTNKSNSITKIINSNYEIFLQSDEKQNGKKCVYDFIAQPKNKYYSSKHLNHVSINMETNGYVIAFQYFGSLTCDVTKTDQFLKSDFCRCGDTSNIIANKVKDDATKFNITYIRCESNICNIKDDQIAIKREHTIDIYEKISSLVKISNMKDFF